MKPSMRSRLEQLAHRLIEVDALLAEPETAADMDRFRKLSRERAELEPVVEAFNAFLGVEADVATAQEMLSDPDMKAMAEDEIKTGRARIEEMEAALQLLLLPRDPDDGRSLFLEIRAGTGGDESALFSGDLLRMYTRYAETRGWRVEIMSESESELGGYKGSDRAHRWRRRLWPAEVRVRRASRAARAGHRGAGPHPYLGMHGGGDARGRRDVRHRDQPQRSAHRYVPRQRAGGQHINKTDSAVRITHVPTGLVVECQDDRSQHRNKDKAMQVLAARLKDKEMRERQSKEAAERKSLIGSGDRSERIRTYNYPQGRVTDHRINLTLYKLQQIMEGDLDELTGALLAEHQAEQLAALGHDL